MLKHAGRRLLPLIGAGAALVAASVVAARRPHRAARETHRRASSPA